MPDPSADLGAGLGGGLVRFPSRVGIFLSSCQLIQVCNSCPLYLRLPVVAHLGGAERKPGLGGALAGPRLKLRLLLPSACLVRMSRGLNSQFSIWKKYL